MHHQPLICGMEHQVMWTFSVKWLSFTSWSMVTILYSVFGRYEVKSINKFIGFRCELIQCWQISYTGKCLASQRWLAPLVTAIKLTAMWWSHCVTHNISTANQNHTKSMGVLENLYNVNILDLSFLQMCEFILDVFPL